MKQIQKKTKTKFHEIMGYDYMEELAFCFFNLHECTDIDDFNLVELDICPVCNALRDSQGNINHKDKEEYVC